MKKILLSAAVCAIAALAVTAKKNDPVVMTIDNRDVKLSEFEYLYNKNNNQQLTPLTFDEYVDMFVNYKLKVADALNARMDTTSAFKAEFDKFRRELAEPYLQDPETLEQLIREAYDHTAEDVYVSHIMLSGQDPDNEQRLDSIRTLILNGQTTFEEAARRNSVDKASAMRGGRMAWLTGLSPYPWTFEKASYDTPVGTISEVVNSGVGFHLIRPEERRPARGEVEVQHILLLTRGMDAEQAAQVKTRIDSIYSVVTKPGVDFGDVARRLSQDPGSAANGGNLGWFGSGRMVAEFDSVSFALPVGAISEPFSTSYGYHIIHKLDERGRQSYDEARPTIEKIIESDGQRAGLPLRATIDKTAAATGSAVSDEYLTELKSLIAASTRNGVDSVLIAKLKNSNALAYTFNGKKVTLGEVLKKAPLRAAVPAYILEQNVERYVNNAFDNDIINLKLAQLEASEPSYSNLVNEYRDGILLFDISNENVWERATKDTEGLNAYFQQNKDKYRTWTAPKFKSYVLFAHNDSVLNEIRNYVTTAYAGQKTSTIDQQKFTADLKERFGKNIKIERVIAAKGDNPITDYLGFGAEKPEQKGQGYGSYMAFGQEIIDQPEEVSDAKGPIVTDYQALLEKQWIDQLRSKYKVKINKGALKKANK